ncbi:MAG: hypothetical protein LBV51_04220 [Acholeplasmatales bacterium]|jgi:DNA polymerase-3 subunit delta|nr:hypothetical protein [Acholeplasmatales bacterium]
MGKVYIINGQNEYLINKEISSIKKELEIEEILSYDLENDNISSLVEELVSFDLFVQEKLIILTNVQAFKKLNKTGTEYKEIQKYSVSLESSKTNLIILINDKQASVSNPLFQELNACAIKINIKELSETELSDFILNEVTSNNFTISSLTIKKIISKANDDLYLITNCLKKAYAYKSNEKNKEITIKDIDIFFPRPLEDKIYELTAAYLKKEKEKCINIYHDLLENKYDPNSLVSSVSNKVKDYIMLYYLVKKDASTEEIMQILKVRQGQLFYLKKDLNTIKIDKYKSFLASLALLDYQIKSGRIDAVLGFELFLLKN